MTYRVEVKGRREVNRLLESLSGRDLQNRTRRGTRAGAKVLRGRLRTRVRSSEYPDTFRKIATRNHRSGATSTGPTSPLLNIFDGGADPHRIAPRNSPVLVNREAGFFSAGPVSHPGMAARPLIEPTFEEKHTDAAQAAIDKMLEGLR